MLTWRKFNIPTHSTDAWRIMHGKSRVEKKTEPTDIVNSWKMISNKLVSPPGSSIFQNALRTDQVGLKIFSKWRRSYLVATVAISLGVVISEIAHVYLGKSNKLTMLLLYFGLFAVVTYVTASSVDRLAERSEFLSSVAINLRRFILFPLLVIILALAASGFFVVPYESMAYTIGAVVPKVLSGDLWRVITGSFVHYNVALWMGNSVAMLFIYPLAAYYSRRNAIVVFISGLIVSQICFITLASVGFVSEDILDGMSGGIFALLGYITADSYCDKVRYPFMFSALIAALFVFLILGSNIVEPAVSNVAHISGYAFGVLFGFTLRGIYVVQHRSSGS